MPDYALLRVDSSDGALVARVTCTEFDFSSTRVFGDEVVRLAASSPGRAIVLDFSDVSFMASLTLGKLVELANGFRSERRRVAICGLAPNIREMLARSAIGALFEIHADAASARKKLN
jgi:anti-anti-sigma factor